MTVSMMLTYAEMTASMMLTYGKGTGQGPRAHGVTTGENQACLSRSVPLLPYKHSVSNICNNKCDRHLTCEMLSTREVSKRFGARVGIGSCPAKVPLDSYVPHLRLQAWKQMLHISDNVCAVWPQS